MNPNTGEIRPIEQVPEGEKWIELTPEEKSRLNNLAAGARPEALRRMRRGAVDGKDTIRPNKKKAKKKGRH